MNTSRVLGALLCIACVAVAAAHIYFGYIEGPTIHLAFGLPVTVGLLIILGLGFWLGWIMASTKEVTPAVPVAEEKVTEAPWVEKVKKP